MMALEGDLLLFPKGSRPFLYQKSLKIADFAAFIQEKKTFFQNVTVRSCTLLV